METEGLVPDTTCCSHRKEPRTPGSLPRLCLWGNHPPETGKGWPVGCGEVEGSLVLQKLSPGTPGPWLPQVNLCS